MPEAQVQVGGVFEINESSSSFSNSSLKKHSIFCFDTAPKTKLEPCMRTIGHEEEYSVSKPIWEGRSWPHPSMSLQRAEHARYK